VLLFKVHFLSEFFLATNLFLLVSHSRYCYCFLSYLFLRCHFLGMCLIDDKRVHDARIYFLRALRTIPRDHPFDSVFVDFMLSYEEVNDMKQARRISQWAIDSGSTIWCDKYQRPGFITSYANGKAYLCKTDPGYPVWAKELKKRFSVIQGEFLHLVNPHNRLGRPTACKENCNANNHPSHWPKVGGSHRQSGRDDDKVVSRGDWRELVLFGNGARENIAPQTQKIIERYCPDAVSLCNSGGGEIIFSVLAPHTHISAHCASTNIRLTAHLGLAVPSYRNDKRCAIRVRDSWYTWEEGEFIIFDDSFEHEVINETDEFRAVLLIRFWHPSIPLDKHNVTIQDILVEREETEKARFVPPLPERFLYVEERGMGNSVCPSCSQTATSQIKMKTPLVHDSNVNDYVFICKCGSEIH